MKVPALEDWEAEHSSEALLLMADRTFYSRNIYGFDSTHRMGGISSGIEKFTKVAMPALLVML